VQSCFHDWTSGLDPRNARISVFEHIRDIPYSLSVTMTDPSLAPEQLLRDGKGHCGPKHYLLAVMYRKLGYDTVFVTFPFLWNDPDLQYPPELRELAASLPVARHLACRVRIDNRWVLTDATWDLPLKRAGFPVNEHWDGRADTWCAVRPLPLAIRTAYCRSAINEPCRNSKDAGFHLRDGEEIHNVTENPARKERSMRSIRSPDEIEQIRRFQTSFDSWLDRVRQTP
jgi:hypothetical protein